MIPSARYLELSIFALLGGNARNEYLRIIRDYLRIIRDYDREDDDDPNDDVNTALF